MAINEKHLTYNFGMYSLPSFFARSKFRCLMVLSFSPFCLVMAFGFVVS